MEVNKTWIEEKIERELTVPEYIFVSNYILNKRGVVEPLGCFPIGSSVDIIYKICIELDRELPENVKFTDLEEGVDYGQE